MINVQFPVKMLRAGSNVFKRGNFVRFLNTQHSEHAGKDVEEIKIPVPWGHIAGKWWGNKNLPPAIAIHGMQDNAGSFDNLIPLLNIPSIIAIDLPGHGHSSHLPHGKSYEIGEFIIILHRLKKYFGSEKLPLLTHSFGGALGFSYTSVFNDHIKWLISFECGRTLMTLYRVDIQKSFSKGIEALLKIEKQKKELDPPVYKLSKMIQMSIMGSFGSITSPEAALVLLKRAIQPSEKVPAEKKHNKASVETDLDDFFTFENVLARSLPEEEAKRIAENQMLLMEAFNQVIGKLKTFQLNEADDKYYTFLRDPCIKVQVFHSISDDFVLNASKNIKCPVLSMRAKGGFLFGSTKGLYEKTLDILKTSSSYFEHHEVDGKWWGSKDKRPILCAHGWQDNANTFDTLIPFLSPEYSYLAIDLPGHGFSSHLPKGVFYHLHETLCVFRRIQYYFGWPKVSLLGHSFGASCSFVFSSCFPETVDFFIAIDMLKPLSKDYSVKTNFTSENLEKLIKYDDLSSESAPAYSKDDLIDRWIKGTNDSLTRSSCEILIKRGTVESNGLFKIIRDNKIKSSLNPGFTQKENLNFAKSIKCSVLFIKASGSSYYEKKEDILNVAQVLKTGATHFEHHELPGTHHLHLNNPETVAPVINSFFKTVGGQQ